MSKHRFLLAAVLALLIWVQPSPALYHEFFPTGADGSFDTYPDEGYAINDDGNFRLAKTFMHFGFMGFVTEYSDGPDNLRQGFTGDSGDGILLPDWIVGKKVLTAYVYLRDASNEFCNGALPAGTYLNEPITILGFRSANSGPFVDRGADGTPAGGGCCAVFTDPRVLLGEMSPVAWRMGPAPYSAKGDIGPGGELWQVSAKDSNPANRNKYLQGGTLPFDPDGDGLGGFSGLINGTETAVNDRMFAFLWLIRYSDAHLVNSQTLDTSDCTPGFGSTDPRDIARDGTGALGWYAVPIDPVIIHAMASLADGCKGLVYSAITSPFYGNTSVYSRDQGSPRNSPFAGYLDITATIAGDVNNDATVNVTDLQALSAAWNTVKGVNANYNAQADFNYDGKVDVRDLMAMAKNWNGSAPW